MNGIEIADKLNTLYPFYQRLSQKRSILNYRAVWKITKNEQGVINSISVTKINLLAWIIRRIFGPLFYQSIDETVKSLAGKICDPNLDQNGRAAVHKIIELWHKRYPAPQHKCPLKLSPKPTVNVPPKKPNNPLPIQIPVATPAATTTTPSQSSTALAATSTSYRNTPKIHYGKLTYPVAYKPLGMTEEEIKVMSDFLNSNFKYLTSSKGVGTYWRYTEKHPVTYNINDKEWKLPRSISIVNENDIFIRLNQHNLAPIAKGGFRIVKYAYNPINGQFLAKKRATSEVEVNILKQLTLVDKIKKPNGSPGLARTVQIITLSTSGSEKPKAHIFQVLYDKNLNTLLRQNGKNLTPYLKLTIIKKLLLGLADIHDMKMKKTINGKLYGGYKSSSPSGKWLVKPIRTPQRDEHYMLYHGDIKPSNILWLEKESECSIDDFDLAGIIDQMGGTPGYCPPNYLKWNVNKYYKKSEELNKNYYQKEAHIEYNLKYGQKKDLWAIGLVIASILKGEIGHLEVCPLDCIKKYTKYVEEFKIVNEKQTDGTFKPIQVKVEKLDDSKLANITQEEIDKEIENIKKDLPGNKPEYNMMLQLWEMVRQMLRVDFDQMKITAAAAAKIANQLTINDHL